MNGTGNSDIKAISRLEAQNIARDAAQEALDRHMKLLPDALKPVMYEVAEKVAQRGQNAMTEIFSNLFGVDINNREHVRELQKDLFWARERRQESEDDRRLVKEALKVGVMKLLGSAILLGLAGFGGMKLLNL